MEGRPWPLFSLLIKGEEGDESNIDVRVLMNRVELNEVCMPRGSNIKLEIRRYPLNFMLNSFQIKVKRVAGVLVAILGLYLYASFVDTRKKRFFGKNQDSRA